MPNYFIGAKRTSDDHVILADFIDALDFDSATALAHLAAGEKAGNEAYRLTAVCEQPDLSWPAPVHLDVFLRRPDESR